MAEEEKNNVEEEVEVVNPGDCIGHWLDGDKACTQCEIEESCKQMTLEIKGKQVDESSEK